MNARERWVKCMHFQRVDHVPDEEFGYWDDTLRVWHEQGMSREVRSNEDADAYFGFAERTYLPAHVEIAPSFEPQVVEETDKYRIVIDGEGVKQKVFKDGSSTIPHYIEFGLKNRRDWEEKFKPRLDANLPARYPKNRVNWQEMKGQLNDPAHDKPIGISIGSLFGRLRNFAGFEGISLLCYDDPKLVQEMISHMATLVVTVVSHVARQVKVDFGHGWEDMCFGHGPIISIKMVREWLTPNYARISEALRSNGCDIIFTDCDGNIMDMIDPWLEGGMNAVFPVEVAGGSDPVAIRKKYGERVGIIGGVNKRALIAGKDTIRAEMKRIKPYVLEGGWIPHVDHRCPPDVTFEDYLYYLDVKRATLGIPVPDEFAKRPEIEKIRGKWASERLGV